MKVIRITTQKVKGENLIWFHNTVHLVSFNRRPLERSVALKFINQRETGYTNINIARVSANTFSPEKQKIPNKKNNFSLILLKSFWFLHHKVNGTKKIYERETFE